MEFLSDMWQFLSERKKYWLAPIIIFLVILSILFLIGSSSAVSSLIYTLF
ncbi:DUF5989 family protein [Aureitalea sp. L0-47]|nr:DUF5989 family protein [Aureitalea sp. L0-47]